MSERESIVAERARKLKELFFLFSNPLQSIETFLSRDSSFTASEFFRDNDVLKGKPLLIRSLPRVNDHESLKKEMANAIQTELYHDLKRPSESEEERRLKAHKASVTDYPSRLMPATAKLKEKVSGVTSLKSQIEVLEAETNSFLNKDISELDILSLPEHYPVDVHSVSSLAELYYLTQTLPLIKLLPGSHKTLMTENFELALLEGKIAVLYSRIEELKRQKKWSLRQPLRYYDPFIYAKRNKKAKYYHWDALLDEGKWMAADFKESSKFKRACCVAMAQGVQDFWSYGKIMCIKRKRIRHLGEEEEIEPADEMDIVQPKAETLDEIMQEADVKDEDIEMEIPESGPEPIEEPEKAEEAEEVEKAEEVEEVEEAVGQEQVEQEVQDELEPEPDTIDISKLLQRPNPEDEIVPPTLPEFTAEDLEKAGISTTDNSPFKAHININNLKKIDQSIIRNLPKFTAFDDDRVSVLQHPPLKPGEASIVPVSRMLYPFDQDDNWYKIVLKDTSQTEHDGSAQEGPPEFQKGLFGVQSHRRFNYLKPPKPPLIKNIEYRSPTIWLPQDDKFLIHYVAEYCFNWDLIAENLMSSASTLKRYESNIERRTPWQCFERYIQLNEKFQFSDMKGINAYQAQQWLEHAHKAQLTTKRRISPLGVGNESIQRGHRRLRWASMFDAMRKTMRKREASLAKTNHRRTTNTSDFAQPAASALSSASTTPTNTAFAANGAANGVKRASDRTPTPSELSKLKFDRDKTIQEAYLNQQATRTRMIAAVSQLKSNLGSQSVAPRDLPQSSATSNLLPQRRMSHAPTQLPGGSTVPQRTQIAGITGALQRPQATSASTLSQPTSLILGNIKRPTTPNGTPYTVEQIQQLLQIQKQRRLMQQQNQAGKGVAPGTTTANMASLTARKLTGSAPLTTGQPFVPTAAGSSSIAQGTRAATPTKKHLFAPAQVSAIINSIQQKNPNLTKEQVTKLAASYLANIQQQQQNKLQQQQQQSRLQQPQSGAASSNQNLATARQAQLQRQRMSAGGQAKEMDAQTLSKMQYEERKKLMMQSQLPPSPFLQSGASSPTYALSPKLAKPQMSPQNSFTGFANASTRSNSKNNDSGSDSN